MKGARPTTSRRAPPATPLQDAGRVAAGAALAFVVALAAFQLMAADRGWDQGSSPAAHELGSESGPGRVPKVEIEEPALGLRMTLPRSWRPVAADVGTAGVDESPVLATAYGDAATGTVLTLTALDSAGRASFNLWLGVTAPLMMPVGPDRLPNAVLGGTQAWLLWSPEADGQGALYGAYLERGARFISLTLAAKSPATDRLLFRDALSTMRWDGADGESVVPELPMP